MARQMVDVYAEFARNGAAMPVIAGAPGHTPPASDHSVVLGCMVTGSRASAALPVTAGALPDLPAFPTLIQQRGSPELPCVLVACAQHVGHVLGSFCNACSKRLREECSWALRGIS
jgi:hypothetical protein